MSNDTDKATARPWVLGECPDGPADWPMDQIMIYDDSHGCIVEVDSHTDWPTTRANAALIVRAVNSHTALVEAVKTARDKMAAYHTEYVGPLDDPLCGCVICLALEACTEALALAGEVTP